jgi:hypothetical protein
VNRLTNSVVHFFCIFQFALYLLIQLVFASDPWDGFEGGIGGHSGGISIGSIGGGHGFGHGSILSQAFVLPIPEIGLTLSKIPILLPIPTIILRANKNLITKPAAVPIHGHGNIGFGGHGGFSISSLGGFGGHGGGWWRR